MKSLAEQRRSLLQLVGAFQFLGTDVEQFHARLGNSEHSPGIGRAHDRELNEVLGIALGVGISLLLSSVFNWPTLVSPWSVVVSAVFSMGIGVFFGYYPAKRAAALDPIEALRFE